MLEKASLRQSKWLKLISICLVIIGSMVFLGAVLDLAVMNPFILEETRSGGILKDELFRYGYDEYVIEEKDIQKIKIRLWRDSLIQLLIGCWIIVCGIGLWFPKRWAWYLTVALTICGSIHACYGIYIELSQFHSVIWVRPLEFILSLSILTLLIGKRHECVCQPLSSSNCGRDTHLGL